MRLNVDLNDLDGFADEVVRQVSEAWNDRARIAPSADSWKRYCQGHFLVARLLRWPADVRVRMVVGLSQHGLSTRSIGAAIAIADQTVRADLLRAGRATT